jgi:hypothetical protein
MKAPLTKHLAYPPTWCMVLLTGIALLLFVVGLFWQQWLFRFVVLPEVKWNQSGIKVFHYEKPGLAGQHRQRKYYSDVEFHMEKPHTSAFGVGVMRLEEPAQLHFLIESDDFGSLAVNGYKYVEQDPTTSALNRTQGTGRLEAGLHLVVMQANNGPERGWFRAKVRHPDSGDWSLLGQDVAIHPVTHPGFDTWWKAGAFVPKACLISGMLIVLGVGYAYRRWNYLDRLFLALRRLGSIFLWDVAWFGSKEYLLDDKRAQRFLFSLPLFLLIVLAAVKFWDWEVFRLLAWDDSLLEYVQLACYLAAALFALNISSVAFKNGLNLHGFAHAILFAGLFFVAMEEISWGQRILGAESPEFFKKHNAQGELTLHNLRAFTPILHDAYIAVGIYGSLAWMVLSKFQMHDLQILKFCVPDWFVSSYFFILFIIYFAYTYLIPDQVTLWSSERPVTQGVFSCWDQEVGELFLSMGFLLFTATKYVRLCAATGRATWGRG